MSGSKISFRTGQGGLPLVRVETETSLAEIYLHGAHLTHFQRRDEKPLLFLSRAAEFAPGKPIRGGVPVILPWFGPREGQAAHGFARTQPWNLHETGFADDGFVSLRFRLPETPESAEWPRFVAEYEVRIGYTLEMGLKITNLDAQRPLAIETCLHTYFAVSDVAAVEVSGLRGVKYLDTADGLREKTETAPAIRFADEVNRVYFDSPETVRIADPGWSRVIEVAKENSLSTVVWNPGSETAKRFTDLADDDYRRMVCVESGNVKQNASQLKPGETASLRVAIDAREL
jgi:D-hexose-6-phosphate mutarotase